MKELKDPGLVTRFDPDGFRGEQGREQECAGDIALLADQLAQIVEELRRTTDAAGSDTDAGSGTGWQPATNGPATSVRESAASADTVGDRWIGSVQSSADRAAFARHARQIYAARRKRAAIFGHSEFFGEPAWDILLDLYVAHAEGKPVSVSSACIASAAPPTTGLRWLGLLADHGMVLREHDPDDQRRVIVRLTDKGLRAMDEFFATASA